MTADEMCELVHGSPTADILSKALERHTTAGDLRRAGFAVVHTPGRFTSQKNHVTVAWPSEPPFADPSQEWPNEVSAAFDSCFNA